ncbi:hypothetical protein AURDEDRAFT_160436 [Auricularia subglabra TFB-10046 SS5]|nr:hypothetical protein AURDEDRAFT_160436 [Auricularia subglabra TFB-10046 SS5]
MRLQLAALVAASLAFSAAAVNVELHVTNTTCQVDFGGHFTCTDIAPLSCCRHSFAQYQSVKCPGLGVTDLCVLAGIPRPNENLPTGVCGPICNTGAGYTPVCVQTGACFAGTGAYWIPVTPAVKVDAIPTECDQVVEPDLVVFTNGQSFRINHDVPAKVTARLTELLKSDPGLTKGVPAEVADFEVKARKDD